MSLATTLLLGGGVAFIQSLLGVNTPRNISWTPKDPVTGGYSQTNFILPQITFEEKHLDRMAITEHPVEQGAAITDHAYKIPAEVFVRYGWSRSGGGVSGGTTLASLPRNISLIPQFGDPTLLSKVYAKLLALQESRQLVNLSTGKRLYRNMLISALATESDRRKENILDITIAFRQVVIVATELVTVPPKEVQADAQKTAPQQNGGTKQLVPGENFNPQALEP